MTETEQLIKRFIDERDSVSDDELAVLVEALRAAPDLAAEVKERLMLNEWLSQRYAVDRHGFVAQVDQRVRDFELGEERLGRQVDDVRMLAERELRQFNARSRRARFTKFAMALSAVVLVAVGIGTWLIVSSQHGIEVVEVVRDASGSRLNLGTHVQLGESVVTSAGEMVRLRYDDGTVVQIGGNSSVQFRSDAGKQVYVRRGEVAANVTKQESGKPMIFKTPAADATVVGTQLTVSVRAGKTWLDVSEGSVQLTKRADNSSKMVNENHVGLATADNLSVTPVRWPVDRSNLVYLFQTGDHLNLVRHPATRAPVRCTLSPRGAVRLNHAMSLQGGSFVADDSEKMMYAAFRQSAEMTVLLTIRPEGLRQSGPARVISCATDANRYNLVVGQQGDRLVAWFRTTGQGSQQEFDLCGLSLGEANQLAVTYRPGHLICYLNGTNVLETEKLHGGFGNWSGHPLVLGDDMEGGHPWCGTLEGIAIYNRFLEEDEVLANTDEYRKLIQERYEIQDHGPSD